MAPVTRLLTFLHDVLALFTAPRTTTPSPRPPLLSPHIHLADLAVSITIAASLILVRFALERRLFPFLFARFPLRIRRKLSENLFYTIFYTTTFSIGIHVARIEHWHYNFFSNAQTILPLFDQFPPPMSPEFRTFYLVQFGFYFGCLIFLLIDTRRSDFKQYIIHHITTLGLVGASYFIGYVRIGLYILLLHDCGDIFLYGTKVIHYLKFEPYDVFFFALFALVFYITRLVMLPRMIWGIFYEPFVLALANKLPDHLTIWLDHPDHYIFHWLAFVVLLAILQLLHCFWYCLILRMIYKEFTGNTLSKDGDIRSEDESSEGEGNEPHKHHAKLKDE